MNNPQSSDEEKAQATAILETATRLQGSWDPVSGEFKMNPRAQFAGMPSGVTPSAPAPMPAAPQQPMPQGGLLPPPSIGGGQPDLSLFDGKPTMPTTGNRKVDAALQQAQAEADISVQAEARKKQLNSVADSGNEYRSMVSKLPMLEQTVEKLNGLADKASYTYADQGRDFLARQFGNTTDGSVARADYVATVRNQVLPLLRDTFGAAFTVKEGESLLATLGDPDLAPQEKKAVLNTFIEQKKQELQAKSVEAGLAAPSDAPAPAPKVRKFNPATGRLE